MDKLVHHTPGWFNKTQSDILRISSKALGKPNIVPPFHCNEISKPLKDEITNTVKQVKLYLDVGNEYIIFCNLVHVS